MYCDKVFDDALLKFFISFKCNIFLCYMIDENGCRHREWDKEIREREGGKGWEGEREKWQRKENATYVWISLVIAVYI